MLDKWQVAKTLRLVVWQIRNWKVFLSLRQARKATLVWMCEKLWRGPVLWLRWTATSMNPQLRLVCNTDFKVLQSQHPQHQWLKQVQKANSNWDEKVGQTLCLVVWWSFFLFTSQLNETPDLDPMRCKSNHWEVDHLEVLLSHLQLRRVRKVACFDSLRTNSRLVSKAWNCFELLLRCSNNNTCGWDEHRRCRLGWCQFTDWPWLPEFSSFILAIGGPKVTVPAVETSKPSEGLGYIGQTRLHACKVAMVSSCSCLSKTLEKSVKIFKMHTNSKDRSYYRKFIRELHGLVPLLAPAGVSVTSGKPKPEGPSTPPADRNPSKGLQVVPSCPIYNPKIKKIAVG